MVFGRKKVKNHDDGQVLASEIATVRKVEARYPSGTTLNFGSPTRCPECGDYGMVKRVDPTAGTCGNHCRVCQRSWVITRRALQAIEAEPTDPIPSTGDPERANERVAVAQRELERAEALAGLARAEAQRAEAQRAEAERAELAHAEAQRAELARAEAQRHEAHRAELVHAELARTEALRAEAQRAEALRAEAPGQPDDIDLAKQRPIVRVLVVEDNPFDIAMVEELLEPFVVIGEVELTHRATLEQGTEATRSLSFDVVLLALDLPNSKGLATVLEWQHHLIEPLPLIALIDEADADLIEQSRSAGVRAVIQKAHLEKLTTQGHTGGERLVKLLRGTTAQALKVTVDDGVDPADRFRPKKAAR